MMQFAYPIYHNLQSKGGFFKWLLPGMVCLDARELWACLFRSLSCWVNFTPQLKLRRKKSKIMLSNKLYHSLGGPPTKWGPACV